MAHYKKNTASNRDALFGGGGGSSSTASRTRRAPPAQTKAPAAASALSRGPAGSAASASGGMPPPSNYGFANAAPDDQTVTPGPSSIFTSSSRIARNAPVSLLTGQAKIAKMADAEDYRLRAKKAMTRGIFSKPDPISAANFYKRAADAYRQCGENRLERLHRIASGDCLLGQDAYSVAAAEYTRAAELAESSEETPARKRQECHKLHLDAAGAWTQAGERGRAAESAMKAAFGLIMGEDATKLIDENALKSVEEAIESFVPDPLNRKRHYRRTGASAYHDPAGGDNAAASELARRNVITDSYAHETVLRACAELIKRRQYESALYGLGAATATLENDGYATVSLHRAFLSEAVLTLAMGDAVAASRDFQRSHLQSTSYLSSRECAMEEDLVRACDAMDGDALDEARSREGPHRAAMANLDPAFRALVGEIRVSGRAKKEKSISKAARDSPLNYAGTAAVAAEKHAPPAKKELPGKDLVHDTDVGFAEMDDIMNQMGLNEDSDDDDVDLT